MLFLMLLSAVSPDVERCAAALKAAPGYSECVVAGPGVALSLSRAEAAELADIGEDARARFARHFPAATAPYAVFFADDASPVTALKAAGFVSVLPWASPESIAGKAIDGALQRASAQKGQPVPADVAAKTRAKLPQVIARIRSQQRDVIAHELGHQWYEAIYWQGRPAASGGYGTAGPDWLDETAAILMEGPVMSAERRVTFQKAWTAATPGTRHTAGAIGDLSHFLSRAHPSAGRVPTDSRSVSVGVVTDNRGAFYDQTRCFADYLLDRTADARVFDTISRFVAGGGTTTQWLANQRRYSKLPRTVTALQNDWAEWIDAAHKTSPGR